MPRRSGAVSTFDPTPRVVLKLQLTRSFFLESLDGLKFQGVSIADFQVAWSF